MRHGRKIHKLDRPKAHRTALISNLATALLTHGRIKTTESKAKALKPVVDRLIATAKKNDVASRRIVGKTVKSRDTIKKLFDEIAPDLANRASGYSRIMRLDTRKGDGAQLVLIELMSTPKKIEAEAEKKTRKLPWSRKKTAEEPEKKAKAKKAPAPKPDAEPEASASGPDDSAPTS
jgi:large subunit ribosomal protein L17